MFELDWAKLVVIGVVALIAIGPKELPGVLRAVGQWMGKIRRMAAEFQGQFQEAMREAEMADLKKHVDSLNDAAKGLTSFDPLAPHDEIKPAVADKPASATAADPAPTPSPAATEETAGSTAVAAAPSSIAAASLDIQVPLPEPPAPVTEKDFAGTAEAKPAAPLPDARDRSA